MSASPQQVRAELDRAFGEERHSMFWDRLRPVLRAVRDDLRANDAVSDRSLRGLQRVVADVRPWKAGEEPTRTPPPDDLKEDKAEIIRALTEPPPDSGSETRSRGGSRRQ